MILNNIECDLDELIRQHGDHKVEAIRELRRLTGLTLKEAKKILDNYEKGNSLKSITLKPGIFQRLKKSSPFASLHKTRHNNKL